jgi:DNA-binding GntR family transcriptional regulator
MAILGKEDLKKHEPIREQVASLIRREIITGNLFPGQQIVEREISEHLETSTTPVKEAIRILVAEGLLSSLPRRGTFVSDFARQNLEQITIMRSALEGVAAHIATMHFSPIDIAELENFLREAHGYLHDGNLEEAVIINTKFHRKIREACNNHFLIRIIENLDAYEQEFRYKALKDLEERKKGFLEHQEILEAIKQVDCEAVENLMKAHVRRSANYVMKHEKP